MPRTHEDTLKAKRTAMAARRSADPEGVRRYSRDYAENADSVLARTRTYHHRRFFYSRARHLSGPDKATHKDLARLWYQQRGRCALTGRKMDRTAQLDHVIARARGGGDDVSNLRWLCREANLARRELSDIEFISLCRDIVARASA